MNDDKKYNEESDSGINKTGEQPGSKFDGD